MALRGGRYEKIAEIASGGMATVYLGRALGAAGFERLVAIKEMHRHIASEDEFVEMFLDEARLAARIHHPNVVATLDVGSDEDGLFLVMEFVEGPSLQQMLKHLHRQRGEKLPIDIALRIFLDALEGLHAAHELTGEGGAPLNLVHRDVSPQNVLVSTDGIAKLTDFGVARAESRLFTTKAGNIKGKVPYMAPEQATAKPVDRRTDVFAAGSVLWEMLAGKRLIKADSEVAMIFQVTEVVPDSPRVERPEIPMPIAAACLRALEKDAVHRYATAAEFAEALEQAARVSNVAIATPRAVAAFVKSLGVHRASAALMPESRRPDALRPDALRINTLTKSVGAMSSPSTHAGAAIETDAIDFKPRTSGAVRVAAVIAAAAVLGGAGWFFLANRGPGVDTAAETPVAAAPVPAPSSEPATPPTPGTGATVPAVDQKPAPSASAKPKSTPRPVSPGYAPPKGGSKSDFRPREL
ncbi:serine/threonine-protein kinase [Polyangium aurulentum]|uniref:serine/threonine-protein kinase n=1 Tax=Polyangium aurulentum TaxID=2567896 RepID=UPI00146B0C06|nr:serine/threonine-protein kinase [Polyangium aurulentum]UQA62990.1 protein kinase [Polyangium aurulentum]